MSCANSARHSTPTFTSSLQWKMSSLAMMFPAGQPRIVWSRRSKPPGKGWLPCRRPMVRTRNAILPDVEQIHAIIRAYSGNGTLLPRTLAELRENVRDFVVAEEDGKIVGCGALHLYGMHLAEI